jgi:hypothetical protein
MKSVLELLDEEDQSSAVPTDQQTRQIAGHVSRVQHLDEEIQAHEAALKDAREQRRHVTTVDLPLAFQALNITRMDLLGMSLTLRDVVSPNVAKDDVAAMHLWLEENGHGDLIKRQVKVPLGRGDAVAFEEVTQFLDQHHIEYDVSEGVAHNTLQAWCRMMVQDGQELPALFNLWIGQEILLRRGK